MSSDWVGQGRALGFNTGRHSDLYAAQAGAVPVDLAPKLGSPEPNAQRIIFTVRDQEKARDFYVRILGGKLIKPQNPCYIKLANSWIILNCGGGPTPDKTEVTSG